MKDKICPRCHQRLKDWNELSSNEKFTVERLPASAEATLEERKYNLFCTRCWFEAKPLLTES